MTAKKLVRIPEDVAAHMLGLSVEELENRAAHDNALHIQTGGTNGGYSLAYVLELHAELYPHLW